MPAESLEAFWCGSGGLGDSVWLEWVPKRNIICKNLAHSLWMLMAYGANVSLQVYSCYIRYEYIAYKLAKDCKRYIHGRRRFHGSIEWWGVQCTVWLVRSTYNSFTNIEKVDNGLIFPNNTTKMNKAKVVVYVYSSHFDRYIIYMLPILHDFSPLPLTSASTWRWRKFTSWHWYYCTRSLHWYWLDTYEENQCNNTNVNLRRQGCTETGWSSAALILVFGQCFRNCRCLS